MRLFDRASIVGTRRTHDGYLAVNARVARAGNVQQYLGTEVGKPEMAVVRVFRPADEVFAKDTLASFAHRPITIGHPSTFVTADTWSGIAKGWSDGEVARDGEFVRLSMLLADADAIRAVEAGTRQISMGYDCKLDWTPGRSPSGEAYDARQTNIRANHIAVVAAARGGPELRIGDSMTRDQTLTISQKREQVAKAYGEAAVRKLAESGAKSAEYKAAYAEVAGEQFVENRDDRFIEGFYESLMAGMSAEEAAGIVQKGTSGRDSLAMVDRAKIDHQIRSQGFLDQPLIDVEAAKPEYAAFRGQITRGGMALDKHYAMMSLLRQSSDGQRAVAAYDQCRDDMSKRHRDATATNSVSDAIAPPQFARDGRPLASLSPSDRAYEEMCIDMNAWRR